MKVIFGFPLEGQTVAAPDGLPRAICQIPVKAKVIHLGVAYPTDVICVFALVDPPVPGAPGQAPQFGEMQRMEFIIAGPGSIIPPDFQYRAPVRTKIPAATVGGPPQEGLIFLFEKQAPKLMIVTPGGRA